MLSCPTRNPAALRPSLGYVWPKRVVCAREGYHVQTSRCKEQSRCKQKEENARWVGYVPVNFQLHEAKVDGKPAGRQQHGHNYEKVQHTAIKALHGILQSIVLKLDIH